MNEYKIWATSVDGCGCSLCAKMEGTAVKCNEIFRVGNRAIVAPPLHDGCRCSVLVCSEKKLPPRFRRFFDAFTLYSGAASRAVVFSEFVTSYFAALYFLELLADAPVDELAAAGLRQTKRANFAGQLYDINERREECFNKAIKVAYDHEMAAVQFHKTEKGKAACLERFRSCLHASQVLSERNRTYLDGLITP